MNEQTQDRNEYKINGLRQNTIIVILVDWLRHRNVIQKGYLKRNGSKNKNTTTTDTIQLLQLIKVCSMVLSLIKFFELSFAL